jgi:putative Holliday junction resolvase
MRTAVESEKPRGRLLGIDCGQVRIGLAITDSDRIMASPLVTYQRRSAEADVQYFKTIVQQEQVVALVVGLPLHMNGAEGTQAEAYRAYGAMLQVALQLPVVYWDERCTTAAAEDLLWNAGLTHKKRKERRDQLAATLLLQSYLDAGCPAG